MTVVKMGGQLGGVQWSNVVCATLGKPGPKSPSRIAETVLTVATPTHFSATFARTPAPRISNDFQSSEAAVDSAGHTGGDWRWRIYRVAAARHLRL